MLTLSRQRHVRPMPVIAVGALIGMLLAGCAAAGGVGDNEADPDSSTTAADTTAPETDVAVSAAPVSFDGVGPQFDPSLSIEMPEGAASVSITFQCDGDAGHSVEYGDTMASGLGVFIGECGEPSSFVWPVTNVTGTESIRVFVEESSSWTMEATFSAEPFVADAAVGADCAAAVPVVSAFDNAENGLLFYERITESEWVERIVAARVELDALVANAQSPLATSFAVLARNAGRDGLAPGEVWAGSESALLDIRSLCNENHTPLYGLDEFGG